MEHCFNNLVIQTSLGPSRLFRQPLGLSMLLPRTRMREGVIVKQLVLSVCQSVCPVKNFEI